MYGTVARMRVLPGKEAEMAAYGEHLARERERNIKGMIGATLYRLDSDPQTVILAVVFADKASYHANAQDPAQHQQYQQMRALLAEDPVWEDGEIIGTL